jgi:signal transduction histidine kinase
LVADVLAWARAGHAPGHRKERLHLHDLAQNEVDLRLHAAEEAQLRLEAELPELVLVADGAWLARALGNLLDNALRHARSQVLVRLSPLPDGQVELSVEDDGPGLPEAEWLAALEPFHRPDLSRSRDTGGAGLGLAIVRAIAKGHGGEAILGRSDLGGLKASLRLPRAPGQG